MEALMAMQPNTRVLASQSQLGTPRILAVGGDQGGRLGRSSVSGSPDAFVPDVTFMRTRKETTLKYPQSYMNWGA